MPWGFNLCKTFPKPRKIIFVLSGVTAVYEPPGWARGMMVLIVLHIFTGLHNPEVNPEVRNYFGIYARQILLDCIGAIFGFSIQFL